MHHTLFISDLHLQSTEPDVAGLFFAFLKTAVRRADALYILGDLFEAWVGDDDLSLFHQSVITAIREVVAAGVPVYLMRGNRDFLLGGRFAALTGCQFLKDPTQIELYSTPVILAHGDGLCTDDGAHQRFRRLTHNPYFQRLFVMLPLFLRRWMAKKTRALSRKHTQQADYATLDVTPAAVTQLLQAHQAQLLIHGHTHRPFIHEVEVNNRPGHRVVLGDWHDGGSVLVYWADGRYELSPLPRGGFNE